MNLNSSSDSPSDESHIQQPLLRCEPLVSRVDSLGHGLVGASGIVCQLFAKDSSNGFTLDPPFFTRLTADAGLSVPAKRLLLSELASFGVAWVGDSIVTSDRNPEDSREEPLRMLPRIASLQLDEPLDVATLDQAAAIELQLCGVPFQTLANSRRARWTPGLPVEIAEFEQLEKRVGVLRVLSGGKCPIGALVSPAAAYEDIRFLIDSGFDFVTLLVDVQYGMSSTSSLRLASLYPTIEQSVKAVEDSGAKTKILVSANVVDGLQMFRCLQMGVSAISIDAFLARSKPKEAAAAKETFGSVLSAYSPATAGASMAWVSLAMTQIVEELNDCDTYAGISSRH
jgi:hypothetical protein